MKKRLILLGMLMCVFLIGCADDNSYYKSEKIGRFTIINKEETGLGNTLYYKDVKTNIMYVKYANGSSSGISPLYNASGTPMTYDEYINEINNNK